jgi:hypothetical protein
VLPAAIDATDRGHAVSHPGVTFGSIVHDGSLGGAAMFETIGAAASHFPRIKEQDQAAM